MKAANTTTSSSEAIARELFSVSVWSSVFPMCIGPMPFRCRPPKIFVEVIFTDNPQGGVLSFMRYARNCMIRLIVLVPFLVLVNDVFAEEETLLGVVGQGNRPWQLVDVRSGVIESQGGLDAENPVAAIGRWTSSAPELVALTQNSKGIVSAVRVNRAARQSLTLSKGFFALAGGDVDASGFSDIAVIEAKGKRRIWKIFSDPFRGGPVREISWGKAGDIPIFVPYTEGQDWPALLRSRRSGVFRTLMVRNLLTGERRAIRLARAFRGIVKVRPIDVFGQGALLLITKSRYWVVGLDGNILESGQQPFGDSDVVVGDFLDIPGEEVAIRDQGRLVRLFSIASGATQFLSTSEGPLVGTFAMGRLSSPSSVGALNCVQTLNPYDGAAGFLWKESEHGGLVILTNQWFDSVVITKDGKIIDGPLEYSGVGNGNRHHWRNRSRSATSYPAGLVLVGRQAGRNTCWPINPASRID